MKHVDGEITINTKLLGRKEALLEEMSGKILDIGCGEGELLIKATILGKDIVGIDRSLTEIETAKSTAKLSKVEISILNASTEKLPFEFNSFDTITMGEVIEHLEEPIKTINYILKFLKPGGKLLITTPSGFAHPDADHKNFFFTTESISLLNKYWIFDFLPTMWLRIHKVIDINGFMSEFNNIEYSIREVEYGDSKHESLDFFITITKKG